LRSQSSHAAHNTPRNLLKSSYYRNFSLKQKKILLMFWSAALQVQILLVLLLTEQLTKYQLILIIVMYLGIKIYSDSLESCTTEMQFTITVNPASIISKQ
jgi:hypothetical protein